MERANEQIYRLVKQWCSANEQSKASEALRQIALITGCLQEVPSQLNEKQQKYVIGWLKSTHPNTYLWAVGQRCVGHPAIVWGNSDRPRKTTPSWI